MARKTYNRNQEDLFAGGVEQLAAALRSLPLPSGMRRLDVEILLNEEGETVRTGLRFMVEPPYPPPLSAVAAGGNGEMEHER